MLKKIAFCMVMALFQSWVVERGNFNVGSQPTNRVTVSSVLPARLYQSQPDTAVNAAPLMAATGAFFALSVADINASAKWYSEKLGLKVKMQQPKQGKAAFIVLEGGGLTVELIQHDDALPLSKAAPGAKDEVLVHGIFKAGVVVEDFDKTVAMLKERGVPITFGPYPAKGNQRANLIIKDNASNLIQFLGK